ncbi:MAG: tetratricopeptide repeat protein [Candidatus Zixiibacteriota bacterium]|nr:MAG: tetratricopeptide repeat protein [candidate division Zixibacteria bacterium]
METYRLNSRVVENDKEYVIQTTNDVALGTVSSEVYVNGKLADVARLPHPEQARPEEVLSLVKSTHGEKKKEIETLLKAYRQAMESTNPEIMYHLGLAFFYKRLFVEARELFEAAVKLNGRYHEASNFLGQAELGLGHNDRAVSAAEKAVATRPDYADYHNNLGEAYLAAKSLDKAQAEFARAIEINLYYGDAYFNYGLALILEARRDDRVAVVPNLVTKANDYFNKAALIYPGYKTATFEKGIRALEARDLKAAANLLYSVRQEKKESHGRRYAPYYMKYALHPQWITEKIVQDRIDFLHNEIVKNPTYVDLYAELSRCYLELARMQWKKGLEHFHKTLEINPGLAKIGSHLDAAEDVYDKIKQVVEKITDQN